MIYWKFQMNRIWNTEALLSVAAGNLIGHRTRGQDLNLHSQSITCLFRLRIIEVARSFKSPLGAETLPYHGSVKTQTFVRLRLLSPSSLHLLHPLPKAVVKETPSAFALTWPPYGLWTCIQAWEGIYWIWSRQPELRTAETKPTSSWAPTRILPLPRTGGHMMGSCQSVQKWHVSFLHQRFYKVGVPSPPSFSIVESCTQSSKFQREEVRSSSSITQKATCQPGTPFITNAPGLQPQNNQYKADFERPMSV